jgi:hypothetical protein
LRLLRVTLERVTPVMTRLGVAVRSGLARDRATTAEIMVQLERVLDRVASGGAASTP